MKPINPPGPESLLHSKGAARCLFTIKEGVVEVTTLARTESLNA